MSEDVIGLEQLLKDLEQLPLTTARKFIVRALRKGAEPIEERTIQLAPNDPETPGSQIRDNIKTTVTEQTATGAIALIGPTQKGFPGLFAEFGTAHQHATPFQGPAFDQEKEQAFHIVADELADSIERELKK